MSSDSEKHRLHIWPVLQTNVSVLLETFPSVQYRLHFKLIHVQIMYNPIMHHKFYQKLTRNVLDGSIQRIKQKTELYMFVIGQVSHALEL